MELSINYVHVVQLREEGTTLHNTAQDLNKYIGMFNNIARNYVHVVQLREEGGVPQFCSEPRYMEEYSVI